MIDRIGMPEVNRWLALSQIDGWGEEFQLLAYIAAGALGCKPGELVPDWLADRPAQQDATETMRAGLDRLAGFA